MTPLKFICSQRRILLAILLIVCMSASMSAAQIDTSKPELSFSIANAKYRQSDYHTLSLLTFSASRPFEKSEVRAVLRKIGGTGAEHPVAIAWPFSSPQTGSLAIYHLSPEMLDEGVTSINFRIQLSNGKVIQVSREVSIDTVPPSITREGNKLLLTDERSGLSSVLINSSTLPHATAVSLPNNENSYTLDLTKFANFTSLVVIDGAGNYSSYPPSSAKPSSSAEQKSGSNQPQALTSATCKTANFQAAFYAVNNEQYPPMSMNMRINTIVSATQEVSERLKTEWLSGVQFGNIIPASMPASGGGELYDALGAEWASLGEISLSNGNKLNVAILDLAPLSADQSKKLQLFFDKLSAYKDSHKDTIPIVVVDYVNKANGKGTLATWLPSAGVMLVPWVPLVLGSGGTFVTPDPHKVAVALAHELGHAVGSGHVNPAVAEEGDLMAEKFEDAGANPKFRERQKLLFSARFCSNGLIPDTFGKLMPATANLTQYKCNNSLLEIYPDSSNKIINEEAERIYIGSFAPSEITTYPMVGQGQSTSLFKACPSEVDGQFVISHADTFTCEKLRTTGSNGLAVSTDPDHSCSGVDLKPCLCKIIANISGSGTSSGDGEDSESDSPSTEHGGCRKVVQTPGGESCQGSCPPGKSCWTVGADCRCLNDMPEDDGCGLNPDPDAPSGLSCNGWCPGTAICKPAAYSGKCGCYYDSKDILK